VRRLFFVIFAPDSQQESSPLSGRKSTQATVRICGASSGLVLGGSSAINIVGAMRLARDLGPGKTIVTILADGGQRYQSKLFNPEFLRQKNLPLPRWMR
ncbi:hypothetical protein QJT78_08910, partial [Bradyrhizobium sp. Mp27]|nr:hypothetical protein [Bradyrhizobium sp. Mp27]